MAVIEPIEFDVLCPRCCEDLTLYVKATVETTDKGIVITWDASEAKKELEDHMEFCGD